MHFMLIIQSFFFKYVLYVFHNVYRNETSAKTERVRKNFSVRVQLTVDFRIVLRIGQPFFFLLLP